MKIGANKLDQVKIKKMAAKGVSIKQISKELNIIPEVVKAFAKGVKAEATEGTGAEPEETPKANRPVARSGKGK
ncbi:MAG TPA: hypothetical protein ENJ65_02130 [Candidatus Tenderia electrophaga]|uniref:Resolvase HTH domain-containing protein n=1 Tax=Candidatus Tenderia electrophaga TaxID=1748243 RepID=A0A832J8H3_9GAMM|nr:hypothetical protein [Candidatus Tenderia electrophaga]